MHYQCSSSISDGRGFDRRSWALPALIASASVNRQPAALRQMQTHLHDLRRPATCGSSSTTVWCPPVIRLSRGQFPVDRGEIPGRGLPVELLRRPRPVGYDEVNSPPGDLLHLNSPRRWPRLSPDLGTRAQSVEGKRSGRRRGVGRKQQRGEVIEQPGEGLDRGRIPGGLRRMSSQGPHVSAGLVDEFLRGHAPTVARLRE